MQIMICNHWGVVQIQKEKAERRKKKGVLYYDEVFQRLGKALMLPVACLPVCGILMGIGYILAPAAMAGEVQGFTAGGMAYSIGLFLIKAGGALIDNMSWLFAIGVAVGMADDADGTAGLAGLVSMYMITTLLSSGSVAGITGHEAAPAFGKIVNQFVGYRIWSDRRYLLQQV